MALVTKSNVSMDVNQAEQVIAGALAGEALDIGAACYLKSSDGLIYMTNATSSNEAAEVLGFTPRAVAIGQPVTLFGNGTRFKYGTALTPGDTLYAAATAGRLDTAATTGDAFGAAIVLTATDIMIMRHANRLISATVGAGTISVTELANDAVETAKIKNVNVTEGKLEVGAAGAGLTGLIAKFIASGNAIGGLPVIHHVLVVAGANGNTDITLTHKTRVVFVIVHPRTSVTSATLQVKNVANNLSDAIIAAVAGVTTFCGSLAIAYDTIAAGTVLRVTGAGGATQPDADVYVIGFRVA